MKQKCMVLATILTMSGSVFAVSGSDNSINALTASVKKLEQDVKRLKAERVEGRKKSNGVVHSKHKDDHQVVLDASQDSDDFIESGTYIPMDFSVPGKSFVSSGPYIGVPIAYSGGHLIVNSPSVNQDFALLKLRYNIRNRLSDLGITESPGGAHLLLSGIVEGQASYQNAEGQNYSSDINLTSAGLDAYILGPGQWLSALIALSYDGSSGTSDGTFANNARTQNSRVFINQAFMTVGRLAMTPFYGTVGQLYVPFGTYSSNMVSSALTKSIARTKARALVLGYRPLADNSFYSAGYVFSGDTHVGGASRINNGGINLGYHFSGNGFGGDFGTGVIANMADSDGMQNVGNSATLFNGFGGTGSTGSEQITHRVPALDLRAMFNVGDHINGLAEYITATTAFSRNDLTQNTHGAKPRALNAELAYTFNSFLHPCSVAVGYGMTKDVLALGVPAERYSLVFNTSIWRDTLQSLELKHEINYAASARATGSGVLAAAQNGRTDNAITAQFDLYF